MTLAFVAAAVAMLIGIIPAGIVLCRSSLMEAVVAYEFITSGPGALAVMARDALQARDIGADVLLGLAVAVVISASVGVLVMRDRYQKLHFVTPAALIAPVLVTLAVWRGWACPSPKDCRLRRTATRETRAAG